MLRERGQSSTRPARAPKRNSRPAALGATRWQIFAQFLTESVALSLIGGVLGVSLAWGLLKVIVHDPAFTLPRKPTSA